MSKETKTKEKLPIILLDNEDILFPYSLSEVNFDEKIKKIIFSSINLSKKNENGENLKVLVFSSFIKSKEKGNDIRKKIEESNDFGENIGVLAELDLSNSDFYEFDSIEDFNVLEKKKIILKGISRIKLIGDIDLVENNHFEGKYILLEDNDINEEKVKEINNIFLENISIISETFSTKKKDLFTKYIENFNDSPDNNYENSLSIFIDTLAHNSKLITWDIKYDILNSLDVFDKINLLIENSKSKIKEEKRKGKEKKRRTKGTDDTEELIEKIKSFFNKEVSEISEKAKDYLERLKKRVYPQHVKERIIKKISNMTNSHPNEANVTEQYIELLLDLPWLEESKEIKDVNFARESLNSHYGLDEVKERIIEYLISKERSGKSFGQIICLVGPPGTGKTSIASSIAKATGRNFVKISLAGVNDVGEIKGHTRTYMASEPGLIIRKMKEAKVINPLFLINEIDKISGDIRGISVINSLLEVLDPEQNKSFHDNYLDLDYDLSKIMFVCTANRLNYLTREIIDRMEIINVSSYTENEKLKISTDYLIPQINEHYNLTGIDKIIFSEEAIRKIIRSYTIESGVRNLKRQIDSVFRKKFMEQENGRNDPNFKFNNLVELDDLKKYLKKEINDFTEKIRGRRPGLCTGLAYTGLGGGDIILIEVAKYPSKRGEIEITGNLGAIMKESARISIAYIKANHKKFFLNKDIFSNFGINIHVPAGAIPKEGPSAGIALTSAIISCLTGEPINNEIGMTGEITLLGNIEPIGGLKEKSIAAERSNLKEIIIPKKNEKDIEDIPPEVREKLKINLVDNYEEVWKIIFSNVPRSETEQSSFPSYESEHSSLIVSLEKKLKRIFKTRMAKKSMIYCIIFVLIFLYFYLEKKSWSINNDFSV